MKAQEIVSALAEELAMVYNGHQAVLNRAIERIRESIDISTELEPHDTAKKVRRRLLDSIQILEGNRHENTR